MVLQHEMENLYKKKMTNQVDIYKLSGDFFTCESQKLFSTKTLRAGMLVLRERAGTWTRSSRKHQRYRDMRPKSLVRIRPQCKSWEQAYPSTPPPPAAYLASEMCEHGVTDDHTQNCFRSGTFSL